MIQTPSETRPVPTPPGAQVNFSPGDSLPDSVRLIDQVRLAELMEEIGPEDLVAIADLFLDETDGVLRRIETAPPGPQLAEDLHFLKGSALNLGLAALAGLCHEAGRGNDCGAVHLNPAEFSAVYEASKLAFRAALQGEIRSGTPPVPHHP